MRIPKLRGRTPPRCGVSSRKSSAARAERRRAIRYCRDKKYAMRRPPVIRASQASGAAAATSRRVPHPPRAPNRKPAAPPSSVQQLTASTNQSGVASQGDSAARDPTPIIPNSSRGRPSIKTMPQPSEAAPATPAAAPAAAPQATSVQRPPRRQGGSAPPNRQPPRSHDESP